MVEVTDRKKIALEYIKTWFIIDVVAIVPFDEIIRVVAAFNNASDFNILMRMSKFSKIYKLVRIMRLVKFFALLKNKENLQASFTDTL
jgi:hypothetical protein